MKEIMKVVGKLLLIINTMLFIISFSFAFVIMCRPFYYLHINGLNLVEKTGYTYSEIKEAYDDALDYCVSNKKFKTGILKYSDDGKDHFKDCKFLFMINFIILGISTIILLIRRLLFGNIKLGKHNIDYYSGISIIVLFVSILLVSLTIGFNKVFVYFHKLFFMGKTNWILEPSKDEIINILPEQFFMNCAILVLSIIILLSLIFIVVDNRRNDRGLV